MSLAAVMECLRKLYHIGAQAPPGHTCAILEERPPVFSV